MVPLLFLLSSLHSAESCSPTPSVPMPMPATCSASCTPAMLPVTRPPFLLDTPSMSGPCAVRTLLCNMRPPVGGPATITYNGGAGQVSDPSTAQMAVTCNAAGTAWMYMGIAITSVTCP